MTKRKRKRKEIHLIVTDEESKKIKDTGKRVRKCMKCQNLFYSRGLRICPVCSEQNLKVGKREGEVPIGMRSKTRKTLGQM